MKRKEFTTVMHYINQSELTPADITDLKKKTDTFLKKIRYKPDKKADYIIPWDLIIIPDYQEQRALKAENNKSIDNLIANWDENRQTPGIANLRNDGKYAGLLFLVDGYHRARAMERLADDKGYTGTWSIIISVPYNEENHVFADQDEDVTRVSSLTKFEARLASNDMNNRKVAAAHLLKDILDKYHMDTAISGEKNSKYQKLAIAEALNICSESLVKGTNTFDWIADILVSSGACQTTKGLSYNMLSSLRDTFYMLLSGRFENVTVDDAKPILIEKMKHHTWETVQDLGIAIQNEDPIHVKSTTPCTRAKTVFSYWICSGFGLNAYGIEKVL